MRWTQITERFVDDIVILDLRGQMMGADSEGRLGGRIRELLGTGRAKILLNLVEVPYIDSEGLGTIINGWKVARQADAMVKVCGVSQSFRSVLKTSRLDAFLEAFESEQDAIDSFRT